jgi:hypothetical protein
MLTGEQTERAPEPARAWADLLERHRAGWVAAAAGEREPVWVDDPAPADAESLRTAAAEGRPVVVGLPADAGGAAAREAERLAAELGGVTVAQRLAAGSLIEAGGGEGRDVVHYLVCVNVEVPGADALTDESVVPLMSGYVRFLEEANRSLSEANARLARERLGVHDSAAAAVVAELDAQKKIAQDNHDALLQARAALLAPRYRAVDSLRDMVFNIPGVSALFKLRSRLIQKRWSQR